jgi:hypothetical protein
VIHGYGSTRGGGQIKRHLHEFLRQHSDCVDGWLDGDVLQNPGITVVYPRWALPQPCNAPQFAAHSAELSVSCAAR